MDLSTSLQDDIYRSSVLGPDRCGRRRALSLLLSGGLFLLLTGLGIWVGSQSEAPRAVRVQATVTLDLTEALPPPPPPPPGPALSAPLTPATSPALTPSLIPETPATLPTEPLAAPSVLPTPGPAAGVVGGAPGGQAGGVAGGRVGGQVGGDLNGVQPPQFTAAYLQNPEPDYPLLSRRLGEEGRVVLRVLVKPDGAPDRIEVRQTSGHTRLDQAALATVRRWRFTPARRGSELLAAWVLVPLSFELNT